MLGPVLPCPDCGRALTFVASWSHRGPWGYAQVKTYECAAHGPVFVRVAETESGGLGSMSFTSDNPDLDARVPAPLKPKFPLKSDAIAVPEPDSE
jgi:hypothetical protein